MIVCVLDASFAFQWLFKDEASPEGDAALMRFETDGALVPALWFVEIVNGLGMAERLRRLTAYDATYLELAARRGAVLATKDAELQRAAVAAGVGLLPPA